MQIIVSGNLAEIVAPLQNLSAKAERAMREGLQEGGNKARTQVRRSLRKQMGVVKYGTIVDHTVGTLSHSGILNYVIRGDGKGLPITDFPVKGKSGGAWKRWDRKQHYLLQSRGLDGQFGKIQEVAPEVTASPWANSRTFKRSFVDPVKGFRAAYRNEKGRVERRTLFGPSISKEIVKDQSLAAFHRSVSIDVLPAIEKRLARLTKAL